MFSYFIQAGVFMGFSITSAVFGGTIIICYSISIAIYLDKYSRYSSYDTEAALSAIMLILGAIEFATGIWAAACLCAMKPCTCCYGDRVSPLQQVRNLPRVSGASLLFRQLRLQIIVPLSKIRCL